MTFVLQYIAFKTRNPEYIALSRLSPKRFAEQVGAYLVKHVTDMEELTNEGRVGLIWDAAPRGYR